MDQKIEVDDIDSSFRHDTLLNPADCVGTMARAKQKSKKAPGDVFSEDPTPSAKALPKTEDDTYEESDEESQPEKDETEEKLEKLVFGDDDEFQKGLKTYSEQLLRRDSEDIEMDDGDESAEEERADGDEKNIEDVDDADVSGLAAYVVCMRVLMVRSIGFSYFSSTLAQSTQTPSCLRRKRRPMRKLLMNSMMWFNLLCGKIVMMNVLLCPWRAIRVSANCGMSSPTIWLLERSISVDCGDSIYVCIRHQRGPFRSRTGTIPMLTAM